MRRYVTSLLVVALVGTASIFAQSKAKATNAAGSVRLGREISSSCRQISISAKASASRPTRRGTCSSTRAAATRGCSSSIRTAPYVREIGQGLYGLEFAHAVRVDRAGQHLGGRRGDQHGHQVQPRRAAS